MTRKKIAQALTDESSNTFGRLTTILAVLTLVSVSAAAGETIPVFSTYASVFVAIEWITIFIFTVEYGLRIWIAPRPREYILSYFGLLDLASIVPTYFGMGSLTFLRSARIVRTMRFMRIIGRTNITHVQNKGHALSKDFALSPKAALGVLILGALACVFFYEIFIKNENTPYETMKIFGGLLQVPTTIGLSGAILIMCGRVFGALSLGFCIGFLVKAVSEKFSQIKS